MNSIVIKAYPAEECKSNIFRLQPDAAEIVRHHQRASGMSASHILSEILRHTKDEVMFSQTEPEK